MHFHIITLFPESIEPYLSASILGRAQLKAGKPKKGDKAKFKISFYNPRDYTDDKWQRVDRRPYGGGPGMVLAPEPFLKAVQAAFRKAKCQGDTLTLKKTKMAKSDFASREVIFFSPGGKQFDQAMAKRLAKPISRTNRKDIVLICGHYEGVDARVAKILKAKHVSIGPYVLTGGELPAATVIDAIVRYIPGVLGKEESREDERVASSEVYTRPEILKWCGKSHRVPKVLLSGNHAKIDEWKKKHS
ncbi:tRNA (guanosine(37)-N1)-methyltransferase TrmD [Candidatus Kaiserbacteria bacterium]|nr:tRNA (guanosine(37)-N1)-methyltransferase TrmD [Candidatus Kaiserbacteria bacterium]